jgi:hypothetical protein
MLLYLLFVGNDNRKVCNIESWVKRHIDIKMTLVAESYLLYTLYVIANTRKGMLNED